MFEAAEVGHALTKEEFREKVPELRQRLLEAQFAAREKKIPVFILVAGVDGAGKSEVVNQLNHWLDVRGLQVHAFDAPSDEETDRPAHWRYWMRMPPRGEIGMFFGSWYTHPIIAHVYGEIDQDRLDRDMERVRKLEQMLAADGALIVKLWFHISRKKQKKRFEKLSSDPITRWRVTEQDWKHNKLYDQFVHVCERALRLTDSSQAPWHIIESSNSRYRDCRAAETVVECIEAAIDRPAMPVDIDHTAHAENGSILATLEHRRAEKSHYAQKLKELQAEINHLTWKARKQKRSVAAVFEGWDAAGKGGCIRRLSQAIDARNHRVISVAAPTDEELAHHYLWRFWRYIPRAGKVTIYDRSWYGRVLVERVEKFAAAHDWQRAFFEINDFEEQLSDAGIAVMKFWMHITPEEQLQRFQDREKTPHKRHKLTDEDWRNRDKWQPYEAAVNDMVARTSTEFAPWTLIAANDKYSARLDVLENFVTRLHSNLK